MRKRMRILLASAMTVGLAAGATSAHAALKPEEEVGRAYNQVNFGGASIALKRHVSCAPINLPNGGQVFSATNTGVSGDIELFSGNFCNEDLSVAYLLPGESDLGFTRRTGQPTKLGNNGAYSYRST